jgi:predicted DNA-binding transcriptional regulator AlpA
MTNERPSNLITDKELAVMLGVHEATIRRTMRREKKGSAKSIHDIKHVVIGQNRRWQRASVKAFIEGREQE